MSIVVYPGDAAFVCRHFFEDHVRLERLRETRPAQTEHQAENCDRDFGASAFRHSVSVVRWLSFASKVSNCDLSFTPSFSPVSSITRRLGTVSTVSPSTRRGNFFKASTLSPDEQTVKTVPRLFLCCSSPG